MGCTTCGGNQSAAIKATTNVSNTKIIASSSLSIAKAVTRPKGSFASIKKQIR